MNREMATGRIICVLGILLLLGGSATAGSINNNSEPEVSEEGVSREGAVQIAREQLYVEKLDAEYDDTHIYDAEMVNGYWIVQFVYKDSCTLYCGTRYRVSVDAKTGNVLSAAVDESPIQPRIIHQR